MLFLSSFNPPYYSRRSSRARKVVLDYVAVPKEDERVYVEGEREGDMSWGILYLAPFVPVTHNNEQTDEHTDRGLPRLQSVFRLNQS